MEPTRRGVRSDIATGWRSALGAARLLRRHPAVLLLPLALTVFNVLEEGVGNYHRYADTRFGRREVRRREPSPRLDLIHLAPYAARSSFREASLRLAPTVSLVETGGISQFLFYGSFDLPLDSPWETPLRVVAIGATFLPYLLGALLAAGYYAVIGGLALSGQVQWASFWAGVRRYTPRLLLYAVLLLVLSVPVTLLSLAAYRAGSKGWLEQANSLSYFLIAPLLWLSLALVPVAVVTDDLRFLRALGRSMATVWRQVGATAVLVLTTAALCLVVTIAYDAAATLFGASRYGTPPASYLYGMPLHQAYQVTATVISVWALLALFLWYREAYPAPVVASEEAPPGVA